MTLFTCPRCQAIRRDGSRFCHNCGAALPIQRPPARRTSTGRKLIRLIVLGIVVLIVLAALRTSNIQRDIESATPAPLSHFEVRTITAPASQWSAPLFINHTAEWEVHSDRPVFMRLDRTAPSQLLSAGPHNFTGEAKSLEFRSADYQTAQVTVRW
jgi:hypothetical protein